MLLAAMLWTAVLAQAPAHEAIHPAEWHFLPEDVEKKTSRTGDPGVGALLRKLAKNPDNIARILELANQIGRAHV